MRPLRMRRTVTGEMRGISHVRTVVRECCKGDDESQWERAKFDPRHPKTPQPMFTKICVGNYVGDICHHAKFYPNRFRGFGSAHAWFRDPRRFCKEVPFWGVAKTESNVPTLIFLKNRHYGPDYDGTIRVLHFGDLATFYVNYCILYS